MARWECIVCGLIYDEREGWPDDGIAPGTKWADVPDDWMCPDCGVGKDDFELIPGSDVETVPEASASAPTSEESAQPVASAETGALAHETIAASEHVVIIGSGLAGYGLAREIRRHSPTLPITLVTADGGEVYSKPLLSTGYTKDLSYEKLAIQTAQDIR